MGEISVGELSGLLNLAVVLIQITFPLGVIIILISFLSNENNAVTWSVVTRNLHSSLWASILSTDSASFKGVRKRVTLLGLFSTFGLILLAVAGVVAPLGLYDALAPGEPESYPFEYSRDTSPLGVGTPLRSGYKFSRLCGYILLMNCPGQFMGSHSFKNETGWYADGEGTMSSKIPRNVSEIYTSGTMEKGNTVSNFFDIQYRYYYYSYTDSNRKVPVQTVDNGEPYTKGTVRYLENLVLKDQVVIVEGLVVEMTSDKAKGGASGVGFRNHTVPTGAKYGATWEEDLLWIEPVTECVDTNLTLEYRIGESTNNVVNVTIVDNGGFAELDYELDPEKVLGNRTQQDPRLWERAFVSAWLNNFLTMRALGIEKSDRKKGRRYRLWYNHTTGEDLPQTRVYFDPEVLRVEQDVGMAKYLDMENAYGNVTEEAYRKNLNYIMQGISNPHQGQFHVDFIQSNGGMVTGVGSLLSSNSLTFIATPGSRWAQPIYFCTTGIRATINRVTFLYNHTIANEPLKRLSVTKIERKRYASKDEYPLWGVEKTNMSLTEASPIWGLITPEHASKTDHLWAVKAPHLWLPMGFASIGLDSSAGTTASFNALESIWTGYDIPDMRSMGQSNYALFKTWQELSKSAETTGKIIDLLWTDTYAQTVVGTKSTVSSLDPDPYYKYGLDLPALNRRSNVFPREEEGDVDDKSGTLPTVYLRVTPWRRKIQYKMVFAIPAFMMLGIWSIVMMLAFTLWLGGWSSIPVLRELLNQTSTGRVVTNLAYPELCPANATSKEWVRRAGMKKMGFVRIRGALLTRNGDPDVGIGNMHPIDTQGSLQPLKIDDANMQTPQSIGAASSLDSLRHEKLFGGASYAPVMSSINTSILHQTQSQTQSQTQIPTIRRIDTGQPMQVHQQFYDSAPKSSHSISSTHNPFGSPFSPFSPTSPYSQLTPTTSNTAYDPSAYVMTRTFTNDSLQSIPNALPPSTSYSASQVPFTQDWKPVHGEIYIPSTVAPAGTPKAKQSFSSLRSRSSKPKDKGDGGEGVTRTDTGLSEVRLGLVEGRGTPIRSVFEDDDDDYDGDETGKGKGRSFSWKLGML
ncbi:hypothetical protein BDZ91DRAFT_781036 [Kalaharituber pfeilii]|nr:hypothetical protein BDZ91DRAFT_781036 [Kalaharituber pfeilii]